jgi:hypothetical protein
MPVTDVDSPSLAEVLLSRMGQLAPDWADGDAARVIVPMPGQAGIVRAFERHCHNARALGAGVAPNVWAEWPELHEIIDCDGFTEWFRRFVLGAGEL